MSSDIAIKVDDLSKCYLIYQSPRDRLKQFIIPRLQKLIGLPVKQYYREFWALKNISFQVNKGESVGIIGRNGSGKSTLLQLICNTLNMTVGSIEVKGRVAALLELGSGFNPDFTGRENIYLNGALLGLSAQEIEDRLSEIILFADIGQFIDQPVKVYSSGMIVRLAFAISVCVEPDILVVDEALAVGDAPFQYKCLERMRFLADNGTTLLFVSHDTGLIQTFCKKVLYLDEGRLKYEGLPAPTVEHFFYDVRNEQRKALEGLPIIPKHSISDNGLVAFGTEDGRICYAFFVPEESQKQIFTIGEWAKFRIGYEYSLALSKVSVSVFLHDYKMLDIGGGQFPVEPLSGEGNLRNGFLDLVFEVKLRPGLYFLTIRLEYAVNADSFIPVDKQPAALTFEVSDDKVDFLGTYDIGIKRVLQ